MLSAVTWTIVQSQSNLSMAIPDQVVDVDGTSVTVRVRNQSGGNSGPWNVGNSAAIAGTLSTNYVDGSSIEFLPGQTNIVGINSGNYRPNPSDFDPTVIDADNPNGSFTGTSSAPGVFGARARATVTVIVPITVDAAFISFYNTDYELSSGVLPITGSSFAANTLNVGIVSSDLAIDGLSVILIGQPVPDTLTTVSNMTATNSVPTGTITNLGGQNRQLTIPFQLNLSVPIDEDPSHNLAATGTGQIVATAVVDQPITISGQKFNDVNGNGVQDGGDTGLAGWTINLDLNADGSVDASTTTSATGSYSFTNLGPGTYRVREVQQAGWTQTTANPADVTASSGANATASFGNRETTPPSVSALSPPDNVTGVPVDANLVITFDENVRKGVGDLVIKRSSDGSTVETVDVTTAQVTVAGATATIDPAWTLSASTDFYVEVAPGVFEDLSGNDFAGISGTSAWNFTTVDTGMRQIVSDSETTINAAAGQAISIPVRYTTSTGNNTLTGLGLRLHYNSSLLTYSSLGNVLPTPVQQQPPGDDTGNWDNDPATDKYVLVSWADMGGNWPSQDLPTQLYVANFTAASGAQTAIRFSASSTAGGYGFESRPITVEISNATLDADGNGTADALSDGIFILRYLFDPTGAWNVNDALGSGATRTIRETIMTFLDGGRTTALDPDGNGTADALSDGILILRYLFDPSGAWNVNDALGSGAIRTTREAIKAYLDGSNPHASPSAPMMPVAMVPPEDPLPQSQAVPADSPSFVVDTTEQVNSKVEAVNGSNVDRARAAISQALVIGDTSTYAFTRVDQKSIPEEGGQPDDLRAVDVALASWDRPTACDVSTAKMPTRPWVLGAGFSDDLPADQFWGDGDLDWFLNSLGDHVNDLEAGEIAAAF